MQLCVNCQRLIASLILQILREAGQALLSETLSLAGGIANQACTGTETEMTSPKSSRNTTSIEVQSNNN